MDRLRAGLNDAAFGSITASTGAGMFGAVVAVYMASQGQDMREAAWPIFQLWIGLTVAFVLSYGIVGALMFGYGRNHCHGKASHASAVYNLAALEAVSRAWEELRKVRGETAVFVRYSPPHWSSSATAEVSKAEAVEQCEVIVTTKDDIERHVFFRSEVTKINVGTSGLPDLEDLVGHWSFVDGSDEPVFSVAPSPRARWSFNAYLHTHVGGVWEHVNVLLSEGSRSHASIRVPTGFGRPLAEQLRTWLIGTSSPDFTIVNENADPLPTAAESLEIPVEGPSTGRGVGFSMESDKVSSPADGEQQDPGVRRDAQE